MTTRDVIDRWRGKNIHVIGPAGTEGATVIEFLLAGGLTTITAHEFRRREDFEAEFTRTHQWLAPDARAGAAQRLLGAPITFRWGERYLEGIERAEVIVVPQAWFRHPANAPLRALRDRGIPFSSMTQLFFELSPSPIIGVTGTNGKFTVAYLIHQMLRSSGLRAHFSGNDRSHIPMLYYVADLTAQDWLVLELSNRQLIDLPYSPHLAVITNLAPHHLDDHGTFEKYVEVKRGIIRHQRADDMAVLNADNPHTAAMASACPHPYLFSRHQEQQAGAYVRDEAMVIRTSRLEQTIPLRALSAPSAHGVENALAACLAASLAGASSAAMVEVLAEFRGLPYRFRIVAESAGIQYIEDFCGDPVHRGFAGDQSRRRSRRDRKHGPAVCPDCRGGAGGGDRGRFYADAGGVVALACESCRADRRHGPSAPASVDGADRRGRRNAGPRRHRSPSVGARGGGGPAVPGVREF